MRTIRYGLAMLGPAGVGGAQFLLSLVLLRSVDKTTFGSFAFLLVASQLSLGLWSALFCAPLPVLLATRSPDEHAGLVSCMRITNLLAAVGATLIFAIIGWCVDLPAGVNALFALFAGISLLRWFARAYAYALGNQLRTVSSDLAFTLMVSAGIALIIFTPSAALIIAYASLLTGALVGMLPFGVAYLHRQFIDLQPNLLSHYGPIWSEHAQWSILGVVTTEATANAHVYILTFFYGPDAFAPIAASGLMIRPITLVMNALGEFERAQMARFLGQRQLELVQGEMRQFRLVLMVTWALTGLTILGFFYFAPRLIFPRQYDLTFLVTGTILWVIVTAARLLRTPENVFLQAAGDFRALAFASVISSGVSVIAVLVLLARHGPLWSISGILLGEIVFALWTWVQNRVWWQAKRREVRRELAVRPA